MIKKIFLTFVMVVVLVSCGVKDDPEYKSEKNYNNNLYII